MLRNFFKSDKPQSGQPSNSAHSGVGYEQTERKQSFHADHATQSHMNPPPSSLHSLHSLQQHVHTAPQRTDSYGSVSSTSTTTDASAAPIGLSPSGDLFSGLTLQQDPAADSHEGQGQIESEQPSAFSFISAPSSNAFNSDVDQDASAPSAFSFISASADLTIAQDPVESHAQEDSLPDQPSAFSFISAPAATTPPTIPEPEVAQESTLEQEDKPSSAASPTMDSQSIFDFLNSTISSDEPAVSVHVITPSKVHGKQATQKQPEIPVATNKQTTRNKPTVVKKARSGVIRPGYAREAEATTKEEKPAAIVVTSSKNSSASASENGPETPTTLARPTSQENADHHIPSIVQESSKKQEYASHVIDESDQTNDQIPRSSQETVEDMPLDAQSDIQIIINQERPQPPSRVVESGEVDATSSEFGVDNSTTVEPPSSTFATDDTSSLLGQSIATDTDMPSQTATVVPASELGDLETADSLAHYSRTSSISSEDRSLISEKDDVPKTNQPYETGYLTQSSDANSSTNQPPIAQDVEILQEASQPEHGQTSEKPQNEITSSNGPETETDSMPLKQSIAPTAEDEKRVIDEKVKTIEKKRDAQLQLFLEKIQQQSHRIAELMIRRREIYTRKEQLQKTIHDAEHQQMEASDREDFEKADQLGETMKNCRQELSELVPKEAAILAEEEELHLILSEEERNANTLKQRSALDVKQLLELKGILIQKECAEARIKNSEEEYRLQQEFDRANREKANALLDQRSVEEKDTSLKRVIAEQTTGFTASRQELVQRGIHLDNEIKELERKLKQKREEATQCQQEIRVLDAEIAQVTGQFEKELSSIAKDRCVLDDRISVAEKTLNQLHESKRLLEQQSQHLQELESRHQGVLKDIQAQIQEVDEFRSSSAHRQELIQRYLQLRRSFLDVANDSNEDLIGLQKQLEQIEAQQDQEKSLLIVIQGELAHVSSTISSLDENLPVLETKKKAAAAAKQYKDAAKYASDIKAAQASKEEFSAQLVQLNEKQETQASIVEKLAVKSNEINASITSIKQNRGTTRALNMKLIITQIQAIMEGLNEDKQSAVAKAFANEFEFFKTIFEAAKSQASFDEHSSNDLIPATNDSTIDAPLLDQAGGENKSIEHQDEPLVVESEQSGISTSTIDPDQQIDQSISLTEALLQEKARLESQIEVFVSEERYEEAAGLQERVNDIESQLEGLATP
eukprot:TRINITY_DN4191_c0_g1_i1.p1 TRINITY_DN4191_c0_g1~~TRINITY_DN4191_c0_g1_i1.p1  ORF type:complete len:1206 (+),score=284.80 TRINITY_DN4191_c0_g1_i1:42-3659(+)